MDAHLFHYNRIWFFLAHLTCMSNYCVYHIYFPLKGMKPHSLPHTCHKPRPTAIGKNHILFLCLYLLKWNEATTVQACRGWNEDSIGFFLSPSEHQDWVLFLLNSGNGTETQDEVFVNFFVHLSTPTIRSWWNQWGRRIFDTHKKLKLARILLCLCFWWFGWKLTQIGFLQSVIIEFYHGLGQRAQ
jgi:hypothetical protein